MHMGKGNQNQNQTILQGFMQIIFRYVYRTLRELFFSIITDNIFGEKNLTAPIAIHLLLLILAKSQYEFLDV